MQGVSQTRDLVAMAGCHRPGNCPAGPPRSLAGGQFRGGRGVRRQRRRSAGREDLRGGERRAAGTLGSGQRADLRLRHARRHLAHAGGARQAPRAGDLLHVRPCRRAPAPTRPPDRRGRTRGGMSWLALASACRIHRQSERIGRSAALHRRHEKRHRPASYRILLPRQRKPRDSLDPARTGFSYASNGFDDDLPYWDRTDARHPLLCCPTRSTATT